LTSSPSVTPTVSTTPSVTPTVQVCDTYLHVGAATVLFVPLVGVHRRPLSIFSRDRRSVPVYMHKSPRRVDDASRPGEIT
jgi:hypothetical protein